MEREMEGGRMEREMEEGRILRKIEEGGRMEREMGGWGRILREMEKGGGVGCRENQVNVLKSLFNKNKFLFSFDSV